MYDLIIIGGGPAGLTAGLYAARARLNVILIERMMPGGQVLTTDRVENYPGFPEGVTGLELIERMKTQAEKFGLPILSEDVLAVDFREEQKILRTSNETREAKAVIVACGANWKKLGIEGEHLLTGKGVSYCATCDGPFFYDQEVAVIGGGDTAVEEALYLTRFASKVHLIHRRDRLRAVKLLQERAMAEGKISISWNTVPLKIVGQHNVEGIELKNIQSGETTRKNIQGVFIFIGSQPSTEFLQGHLQLDPMGFVVTDENMQTSVKGVFAAGDVRSKLFRQISTAVGDGAAAAYSVEKHLENL